MCRFAIRNDSRQQSFMTSNRIGARLKRPTLWDDSGKYPGLKPVVSVEQWPLSGRTTVRRTTPEGWNVYRPEFARSAAPLFRGAMSNRATINRSGF